ncbi:MAG: cysteine--tRNA ligase [Candidatus Electronema sp. V4]|uniref:cysteine--tRNA ligase n=1 Tax=Candidatus Electronema sp. V4 TaxID=3454756 RepID=UPI00405589D7
MNLLSLIGNTPIVPLRRLVSPEGGAIFAKLEAMNPGGSVKDRPALNMIETGEESGLLTPDKIVLEATSGNTGIGLAMVCAAKGYRCCLVMPESASMERRQIMRAYGAELILTPARRSTDGAIEKAYSLALAQPELYFLTDQFNNPANWQAHCKSTAPEIWRQTEGKVTHIVTTLGTSGTAMGLSRWFREHQPEVRVVAVEPYYGHKIQGLKNMKESYRPEIFDKTLPHQIVNVADEDAFRTARLLAQREGILVGMSSGAAMFAAMEQAAKDKNSYVVAIFPDGGERYLSTTLFVRKEKEESLEGKIRYHNSMSRKKEIFKPADAKSVTFYACGPTACEPPNLAHCRRMAAADLMIRHLRFSGFEVQSLMNFTDLDDKTIAGADKAGQPLAAFTERHISLFREAMGILGINDFSGYPRASEQVAEMIDIAHKLIHKGYAYEKHGSIYFDISKFKKYGRLSGIDLSKIQTGCTVDLDNYDKDNPRDFTLLKRSTLGELKKGIFFATDWGNVRPGWHIECTAMSTRHLGETIDIHTGGQELLFPHHENEIAIAESLTGKPLAQYWLHSGLLLHNGKKMAQESGNVVTLQEVLDKGYSGREIRFMLLGVHYRKSIEFSYRKLDAFRNALKRIDEFTRKLLCLPPGLPHRLISQLTAELEEQFTAAMNDDLNISGAIGALFEFIKKANPALIAGSLDLAQKNEVFACLRRMNLVLGFLRLDECALAPEINRLIQQREEARRRKDWAAADEARSELLRRGVTVHDTASGPVWEQNEACRTCDKAARNEG